MPLSTGDVNQLFDERFARAVAESLEATFGYPFDLWLPGERWTRFALGERAVDIDPAPQLRELLDQARTAGHIPVHGRSAEGCCLAIPVRHERELAIVATASRPVVSDETLRLAAAFLRELGLREELRSRSETNESYAVEVTRSLEEIFLLRQLSRHADLADLSRPATDLACATIDLLRHVVNAEAVYYLAVPDEGARATDHASLSVDVVAQAGWTTLGASTMRRVIDRFGDLAAREPVVENRVQDSDGCCELPGIHQVILAAVFAGKRSTHWLLAVNRVRNSEGQDCRSNQGEFGSVEAGMMSTVASILATHTRNHELFHEKEDIFLAAVRSLVSAIDAKDAYTCGHSERVALFARRLGEEFGLDVAVCHQLYLGGLLHDVGKIGVQDATLSKRGRLTEEEFSEIKKHPIRGWEILAELDKLTYVWPAVVHHHEHFDGTGYPDALAGADIPLVARILAVADTYDALTSDRPYRQGMTQERAEAILREGAGTQWDPRVVEAMFGAMPDMISIRHQYQPQQPPVRVSARANATGCAAPSSAGADGLCGLAAADTDSSCAKA